MENKKQAFSGIEIARIGQEKHTPGGLGFPDLNVVDLSQDNKLKPISVPLGLRTEGPANTLGSAFP